MRVIAGECKGFKLKAPKGDVTRPTSDKVKESLFNIVENLKRIDDNSKILDLYAGSGSIGIEFLSRGACKGCFIDIDKNSLLIIKENLNKCKLENISRVYKNNVIKAIDILSSKKECFDYIFMDPPYNDREINKVVNSILDNNILNIDGILIIEHNTDTDINIENEKYQIIDERVYGLTKITICK